MYIYIILAVHWVIVRVVGSWRQFGVFLVLHFYLPFIGVIKFLN